MGIFDLFGKDPRNIGTRQDFVEQHSHVSGLGNKNDSDAKKGPVAVFVPSSYSEVERIIDTLKLGKTAVVHLNELKSDTALRILDMLSGAIYALGGGVYEMEKNIFMFSPQGVEMHEK